jgi:hypothetical protein
MDPTSAISDSIRMVVVLHAVLEEAVEVAFARRIDAVDEQPPGNRFVRTCAPRWSRSREASLPDGRSSATSTVPLGTRRVVDGGSALISDVLTTVASPPHGR